MPSYSRHLAGRCARTALGHGPCVEWPQTKGAARGIPTLGNYDNRAASRTAAGTPRPPDVSAGVRGPRPRQGACASSRASRTDTGCCSCHAPLTQTCHGLACGPEEPGSHNEPCSLRMSAHVARHAAASQELKHLVWPWKSMVYKLLFLDSSTAVPHTAVTSCRLWVQGDSKGTRS
jgi:hypothetical protein